jgi:hypothetical protein
MLMNFPFRHFLLLSIFLWIQLYSVAQTESLSRNNDTTYTLVGDTLFTNQHFKIAVGQPIIIGKASGERDWYQTITFKSGASWPLLFLQKAETSQNLEYQMDPSVREKDKVKEYLTAGDTLIVTKIKRLGRKRFGNYWYMVTMGQKQGLLSLNFNCDIINATKLGEVISPK